MMGTTTARAARATKLNARLKIWLEVNGRYAFGHGLCEMLQAVEDSGSIKHAAGELGKSYRYVWGRIKAAERILGGQLVEAHVGGKGVRRSALTAKARQLIADFLAVRRHMIDTLRNEFNRRFGL
jgi:molybdate transport repressor ModE-like protein